MRQIFYALKCKIIMLAKSGVRTASIKWRLQQAVLAYNAYDKRFSSWITTGETLIFRTFCPAAIIKPQVQKLSVSIKKGRSDPA